MANEESFLRRFQWRCGSARTQSDEQAEGEENKFVKYAESAKRCAVWVAQRHEQASDPELQKDTAEDIKDGQMNQAEDKRMHQSIGGMVRIPAPTGDNQSRQVPKHTAGG